MGVFSILIHLGDHDGGSGHESPSVAGVSKDGGKALSGLLEHLKSGF